MVLLPAEDLSERQNLSITVPHGHSWSLFAAQATQDGSHCFVLVHRLSLHHALCQLLLRSISAYSVHVLSLFATYCAIQLSDSFMHLFFSAIWERETDGLHSMDLHERQVKLGEVGTIGSSGF